jgi:hypothetical protein
MGKNHVPIFKQSLQKNDKRYSSHNFNYYSYLFKYINNLQEGKFEKQSNKKSINLKFSNWSKL